MLSVMDSFFIRLGGERAYHSLYLAFGVSQGRRRPYWGVVPMLDDPSWLMPALETLDACCPGPAPRAPIKPPDDDALHRYGKAQRSLCPGQLGICQLLNPSEGGFVPPSFASKYFA